MVIVEHTTIIVVNMGEYHTEESEADHNDTRRIRGD